jgi:hypothetical protein
VSKLTFVNDLKVRIREAEQIIALQNENLTALRHLLRNESGEEPAAVAITPENGSASQASSIDFKGKPSEIVLALVEQSGERGARPREIAEVLVTRKLMIRGSNAIHSHLSELKKKGLVQQRADGLYTASSKSATAKPVVAPSAPVNKSKKKRTMSPEGREAIRKAQKARWAAVKKTKG